MAETVSTTPDLAVAGRRLWSELRAAVGKAVVGGDEAVRLVAIALLADGHVLVEDVPGTGKTLLARAVASALSLDTARLQGTPDLLPSDVTGASLFEPGGLRFVQGPVFTNVLLVDEINRATPRTQSALLEAMQEHQVSVEGTTRHLPDPFVVLATQNPVEFEGTFALPQAQLDRFLVRARLGYPDPDGERRIARRFQDAADPSRPWSPSSTASASSPFGIACGRCASRTRSRPTSWRWSGRPAATRTSSSAPAPVRPSPCTAPRRPRRCSRAARFVTPDDVKGVAPAVLGHRLTLNLDRTLHGATVDTVLASILGSVAAPPVKAD